MSGGAKGGMTPGAGREGESGWGWDSEAEAEAGIEAGDEVGFDRWLSSEVSLSAYYGGTGAESVGAGASSGVWVQLQEDRMPEALRDRIMRGLPEGVYPAGPWYMRVVRVGVTWYHRFFRR